MPLDSAGNTTPDYAGQVSALQQGLANTQSQAPAAAPQYQAPADPVTQTFFGKLLTGALQGLAGGVRSGMINEAGRGTPGFKPDASGADYAGMLQKQQNDQDLQNQAQARQAAQQKFTNDSETYRNQQAAIAQKAQAYQAQINALHTAQAMQYATADQQRAYLKGQSDMDDHLSENGVPTLGSFTDSGGQSATDKLAAWMKQTGKEASDFTQVHLQGPKGEDIIKVYDNPDHQVDADTINKHLASVGSQRKVTGSMSYGDVHALYTSEGAKAADQIYAKQAETFKAGLQLRNEQALESQRAADAQKLEGMREKAKTAGLDPDTDFSKPQGNLVETKVNDLANGRVTVAQATKGMGISTRQANDVLEARYNTRFFSPTLSDGTKNPDYNPNAPKWPEIDGNYKAAYSNQNTQFVQGAAELLGTTNADGTTATPGALQAMKHRFEHLQQQHPLWFSTGPTADIAMRIGNWEHDPIVADIKQNAGDLALSYARMASRGAPSSDATFQSIKKSVEDAKTPLELKAVFDGMDNTAANALAAGNGNPALKARLERIKNPGTSSDQFAQPPASGGNQSGSKRPQGATHIVPGSDGKMHYTDGKKDLGIANE